MDYTPNEGSVWREGQKDGALAVFAHVLHDHGIDIRDATLENPKVKELAEKYGVIDYWEKGASQ